MKNKNQKSNFVEKEWYRRKIVEIVNQIEDKVILKKIYTFAKTLNDISKEEGV